MSIVKSKPVKDTVQYGDDEFKIIFYPLDFVSAIKHTKTIAKVILPILGGSVDSSMHDDILHGAPKNFTQLAMIVCDQLESAKIEEMFLDLFEGLKVDGEEVDPNEFFSGSMAGMAVAILEKAMRENFESFFTKSDLKTRFAELLLSLMGGMSQSDLSDDKQED